MATMNNSNELNRRHFLAVLAALGLSVPLHGVGKVLPKSGRYKIGVIDLMLLKRQKISALTLASEIGADGIEIDMGGLGDRPTFDNKLADAAIREEYLSKARELNLQFCSLAMTGFYAQSLAKREGAEKMVQDCITTMQQMNVKVAFLPLGVQGDLVKNPELRPLIVDRLKKVGRLAEKAGVTIGIETALDAACEVRLLSDIGSKAIKIYFNFSNPLEAGRDLCEELRLLGKKRICQIHCTDKDGVWLENNTRLDMKKVRKTLDEIGYEGWLVVERSRDAAAPRDVKGNYGANTKYLKSIFQV
jgi:L-ribulose-5-phosphate 3-epimerase